MAQDVKISSGGTISVLLFLLFIAGCNSCNKLNDIHNDLQQIIKKPGCLVIKEVKK